MQKRVPKINKNVHIDVEQELKEELQLLSKKAEETSHQMVENGVGQFVDAHIDMSEPQLRSLGEAQVETLLVLQTDSDTLRVIENIETENEVIDRIKWGKKKKKKSKKMVY